MNAMNAMKNAMNLFSEKLVFKKYYVYLIFQKIWLPHNYYREAQFLRKFIWWATPFSLNTVFFNKKIVPGFHYPNFCTLLKRTKHSVQSKYCKMWSASPPSKCCIPSTAQNVGCHRMKKLVGRKHQIDVWYG